MPILAGQKKDKSFKSNKGTNNNDTFPLLIVNGALNSTLSRTLNTSLTTLVVLLAMFLFGADSLRGLLFALIIGVLVGTYSSVFIATPIMHDTLKRLDKKA